MKPSLTYVSEHEYDRIRSGEMTPAIAAQYLQDERVPLRSFRDVLVEMYPHPDLALRLVSAFQGDDASRSVNRKVNNWLSGASRPTDREDVFRIAFALDLTEDQAGRLLGICTEYGIHYRDGRDAVYAWCLRRDMGYLEARALFESLPPVPAPEEPPPEAPHDLTHQLKNIFALAQTVEDLREGYTANLSRFGAFHLRAYRYFSKYMRSLIRPASSWEDVPEEQYSLETVMSTYLSLRMPSGKSRSGYSLTQKLIKQGWPNATALKNIMAQRADVPRKLLLLLYIITENVTDGEYSEMDEDYTLLEDRLSDHWWVVNAMLMDCGMPVLDPRNAFDWLVLYSLTASGDESMSERMEQVIDKLYESVR